MIQKPVTDLSHFFLVHRNFRLEKARFICENNLYETFLCEYARDSMVWSCMSAVQTSIEVHENELKVAHFFISSSF